MNIKDYVANNNLWRSSMTPLDSDYVTWEKSAGGIRPCVNREAIIDGINASGLASVYNGCFKVIQADTVDWYAIVDGNDLTSLICGYFIAGSTYQCDYDEVEATGAGVIYIRIYFDTTYKYQFIFSATVPTTVQEVFIPLASIYADKTIGQAWTDGTINLNGQHVT